MEAAISSDGCLDTYNEISSKQILRDCLQFPHCSVDFALLINLTRDPSSDPLRQDGKSGRITIMDFVDDGITLRICDSSFQK